MVLDGRRQGSEDNEVKTIKWRQLSEDKVAKIRKLRQGSEDKVLKTRQRSSHKPPTNLPLHLLQPAHTPLTLSSPFITPTSLPPTLPNLLASVAQFTLLNSPPFSLCSSNRPLQSPPRAAMCLFISMARDLTLCLALCLALCLTVTPPRVTEKACPEKARLAPQSRESSDPAAPSVIPSAAPTRLVGTERRLRELQEEERRRRRDKREEEEARDAIIVAGGAGV